ncbi:PREDICTED: uncharacterized protein LOC104591880 isoform X2 [Nelumbo nucifera]|uniref:DEUBAD domain-containing protein n=2 Tax=Nelumbo nucifera TaxID=4432 RepID=A0A822YFZ0_NELNU|nr:PREDICTED: uncharacterized protein LOC104591880 isoform X2 [Nelumbo nucifera]DAD30391.1 TPA_asm: hypothetical protein HUJ06_009242 [Nelumbo nucifera]
MAAGQQKKRLNASSVISCNLQDQYREKKKKNLESPPNVLNMRSHISLEWDNIQKRAVAKKEQIGISWRDLSPFPDFVPHRHTGLADVFAIPWEIFGLENMTGVLSYEVWETLLSEKERDFLIQFLPSGTDAEQVVQALLLGENFHFGNPFLKWGSSLCSGDLHPDAILCQEQNFKTNKKAYYSELQKYHNDIVQNLQKWKERWASSKDPEKDIVQKIWRSSRKRVENGLESYVNESKPCDPEEIMAATAESCSWVADEKVCGRKRQSLLIMKHGEPQERKGTMDKRRNLLVALERPKVMANSIKEEKPQKLYIRSCDGAKYMSYFKVSRKQHQLVKRIKQSADGIQSKSLNRVLGDIKSFHVEPYETFEEEERKKLHEHWSNLAKRDLPAAFSYWKNRQLQRHQWRRSVQQELAEKEKSLDEEQENVDNMVQEQEESGKSDNEGSVDVQSCGGDEESVPNTTHSRPLERILSLNGQYELDTMDIDSDAANQKVLKPESAAPSFSECVENTNPTEESVDQEVPIKDVWPEGSMPNSYYHTTSASHGYTSSSELSLGQPKPVEEQSTRFIDLESDILEQDTGEVLLHRPSNDAGSSLHVENGGSFFNSYTNQERSELLHPFLKGQEMIQSYPHEHKQTTFQFLSTNDDLLGNDRLHGNFCEQENQLEQREMREKELYMHQMIQKNMYSNGGGYPIPSQDLFSSVNVQDWAVNPVRVPVPVKTPLNSEGLLGQNWFPGEHRARGGWSGVDISSGAASLENGSNTDESLFSVLSQCNKLKSLSHYDTVNATEHYIPSRNFVGGGIPGNMDFPGTDHQLNYLSGREAPSATSVKGNSMSWMNMQHQSSGLNDALEKPFLRSWNQ